MKIVIPGGTGHLGRVLETALSAAGHEVVVVSRGPARAGVRTLPWDGRTIGPWAAAIDGADAVINLAGRSVDCRYTNAHLAEMKASRVDSTRVVGAAIAQAARPPRVWLQASTATIYAHRYDAPNDEATGRLGGGEPGAPRLWDASIDIAKAWEAELAAAPTPWTRKVAMRTAIVTAPLPGSAFHLLSRLARAGLGGRLGDGRQFMSWVHDADFASAVLFLLERDDLDGAINIASPSPLPQRDFARDLREAWGVPFGLPVPKWALEIGTFVLRTESELVLKSRCVVPARLLASGFEFLFPQWSAAARDLVSRMRAGG